jgi:regulator of RNase E activity RraA
VNPGDLIVGDRNGVCVIPAQYVLEVIENAAKKLLKMRALREEILSTKKVIPDDFAKAQEKLGY